VSAEQASRELETIAASLAREFPATNDGYSARARPLLERIVSPAIERALTLLLVAAALLHLVACANVANLVLTRALARTPELALRRALGAAGTRLARQIASESIVLAVLGGGTGLLVAAAGIQASRSMLIAALPRAWNITLDIPTLAGTAATVVLTALVCAAIPVWRATHTDVAHALPTGTRSAGERSHSRLRNAFVVAQFGLATVLVTVAVLLTRSLFLLLEVQPGFQSDRLLLGNITLPTTNYANRDARNAFYHRVIDALATHSGVESAAFINRPPLAPDGGTGMEVSASAPVNGTLHGERAHFRIATSSYFRTIGIPLIRGSLFDSAAPEAADGVRPLVLSESLARRLWPDAADPINRRVWLGNGQVSTVVGVVGDVHQGRLGEGVTPTMYWPTSRTAVGTMTLVVRTIPDPSSLVSGVRRTVAHVDSELPIFDVRTMTDQIGGTTLPNRLNTALLGTFAALALTLGLVGVAGVIAYSVAQRRPELAIRMALGASTSRVVREVAAGGIRLCFYGLVAGMAGAWALGRGMASLLFGVRGQDPLLVVAVGMTLFAVAVIACALPALRAARIDPAVALRSE
jgi:putative ABC transport system permease protein